MQLHEVLRHVGETKDDLRCVLIGRTKSTPQDKKTKLGFNKKMSKNDIMRDVRHIKAARELLRWDQERLAKAAGLSLVSVRRYEAARDAVADHIERDVVAALEAAGVVFVPEDNEIDDDVSGGVLLKRSAVPESPAAKRVYVYKESAPGRPIGKKDGAQRKLRARKDDDD